MAADQARSVLRSHGMNCNVEGTGARVAFQSPEPGVEVRSGESVRVLLSVESPSEAGFPDLRGLSLREAVAKLSALSIPVASVRGTGRVVDQSPAPGAPRPG